MSSETITPDAKERLLQAAVEVFAEKGFKAATVREIVDKAGANIAGVNYHFGDKDRLYIAACRHAHTCSSQFHLPIVWPAGLTAPEKLRHFIRGMVHSMTTPVSVAAVSLMMRELANPTAAARGIVHDYIQPMAFELRTILRAMLPGHDEHRLLMIGFSVIGQCLFYRQNRAVADLIFGTGTIDAMPAAAVADHIERFTLAALGQTEPITINPEPL